jgi:GT2 family glycosyltransferase
MEEATVEYEAQSSGQVGLPPTSLTICSRNRPQLLLETVESVLEAIVVPTEIVIVDQSDVPHPTLARIVPDQACEIRYTWSQTMGVGRARNAAISAAKYDILALTDDDMRVTSTWFGALIRALLEAGPRCVVTGRVLPAEVEVPGGFAPSTKVDQDRAIYEGRIGQDVLFTNNMALHRSTIQEIGLFDERLGVGARFSAAYDNDFGFRLLEAGYRILYIPEAVLYHRAWRSERDYAQLCWNYGRGQGAFYAKHLSLRDRYMLRRMLRTILRRSIWAPLNMLKGRRWLTAGDVRYIFGLISGASEWLLTHGRRTTRGT